MMKSPWSHLTHSEMIPSSAAKVSMNVSPCTASCSGPRVSWDVDYRLFKYEETAEVVLHSFVFTRELC